MKSEFILTPALKSGHPAIDAEHQDLFDRTNALIRILGDGDRQTFLKGLDELCERIVAHFENEIALLRGLGFPSAGQHAALHERMTERLVDLRRNYDARDTLVAMDQFHDDILSFLIHDVVHEDLEFKSFLTEMGYAAQET